MGEIKKFDLFYRGEIYAQKVSTVSKMPKKSFLLDCDYLKTDEGLIGKSVSIYQYTTPTKTKLTFKDSS